MPHEKNVKVLWERPTRLITVRLVLGMLRAGQRSEYE